MEYLNVTSQYQNYTNFITYNIEKRNISNRKTGEPHEKIFNGKPIKYSNFQK